MQCRVCGAALLTGARFCAVCGTRVAVEAPAFRGMPEPSPRSMGRVEQHLQIMAILWFVQSVMRLGSGLMAALALQAILRVRPCALSFFGHAWVSELPRLFVLMTLVTTVLSIVTGYGLLQRRPWGRRLALITAVVSLVRPFLGSAVGIYTLWVLSPGASAEEYRMLVSRQQCG